MFRNKKNSNESLERLSAEQFCEKVISGFKTKALHNKNESMWCFWVSMGGALLVPVFITLGAEISIALSGYISKFILSTLAPTLISVCVAFSTAWLQLRKPQQLWALYRTSQRELEDNLYKFQYQIGEYENAPNPDGLLVQEVAEIALKAHYSWLPMVPNPENMQPTTSIPKVENSQ